jgi:hypothetical protein
MEDRYFCENLLQNTPDNLYKLPIGDLLKNLRVEYPDYFDN